MYCQSIFVLTYPYLGAYLKKYQYLFTYIPTFIKNTNANLCLIKFVKITSVISVIGERTAWTMRHFTSQVVTPQFPNAISCRNLMCLKSRVLLLVTCTSPLSNRSSQFQTIGGISHHNQQRVGG